MGDIHIKIEEDGIKLWRTVNTASGVRKRVKGSEVKVASKAELVESLPIFQPVSKSQEQSGELDDNRTG